MAITTLDPRTALLVVDLQLGLVANPTVHPIGGVIAAAAELVSAFRAAELPVVFAVNAGGPAPRTDYSRPPRELPAGYADVVPELERRDDELLISRDAWSAFAQTELDASLRRLGITQVVIVGIATGFGVESTVRAAHDLGYHVTLPTDAMTDLSPESHAHSTTRVFPALAETGSTTDVLAQLAERRGPSTAETTG